MQRGSGRVEATHDLPEGLRLLSEVEALRGQVITIVGGYGRMGRLFARIFKRDGFDIVICGPQLQSARKAARELGVKSTSIEEGIRKADTILVSVPIESTYVVCKQATEIMREDALLIDIASVKTGVADRLFDELPRGVDYTSIHPLFGSNIRTLRERNVVLIEGSRAKEEVASYFRRKMCNVVIMDVREHDRAMALLQVVHHFALLSYLKLLEKELGERGLSGLSPESLKMSLRTARRLARSRVVESIRRENPHADEAIRLYLRLLSRQA